MGAEHYWPKEDSIKLVLNDGAEARE